MQNHKRCFLVLGVNGSPRPKGNSQHLMSCFMEEMK